MNCRSWLSDVREHADPNLTCILVANKIDLCEDEGPRGRQREIPTEEGETWAKEEGLLFVEASAKSGQNVELAFLQASKDILDKVKKGVFDEGRVSIHLLVHKLRYSSSLAVSWRKAVIEISKCPSSRYWGY